MSAPERPVFVIRLQATRENADVVRTLRALLKAALRQFKFRCLKIEEWPQ